jgi:hypothetical protein
MQASLASQRLRDFQLQKRRKQRLRLLISRNKTTGSNDISQTPGQCFLTFTNLISEISNYFMCCSQNHHCKNILFCFINLQYGNSKIFKL